MKPLTSLILMVLASVALAIILYYMIGKWLG